MQVTVSVSEQREPPLSGRLSFRIVDIVIRLNIAANTLPLHHLYHFVKVISFNPEKVCS
jgi:hypothetical protein